MRANPENQAGGASLPETMRTALDRSMASDELRVASSILALDSIASILPALERSRWGEILREFTAAAACSERSPSQARGIYIQILESTAEPSCAALAASRLKTLPVKAQQE